MKIYSQYGEENILNSFFNYKKKGYFVDIGAADGEDNSNTRYLSEFLNWTGILIEPHPYFYNKLYNLYKNENKIKTLNLAVSDIESILPFYLFGSDKDSQVSTLEEEFKQKVITAYGDKFSTINIQTTTLKSILKEIYENKIYVDFLSIDCEGADIKVLRSNDWNLYRPSLICVEHSMEENILHNTMTEFDYKIYSKTVGNTFFVDNK